ncbi:MAG: prepilin-type N-terminal cleavage/methylation domain-containing protein [Elusimicrobiaceae bacterium]|nr:prepilin-type N-terminal cleavage/methylation domain-containing protein [Elusimicrobiaceae bacterium]
MWIRKKGAFTLIELLVVVLIIGILSAIALPQYQKTVEKAKATQALTVLSSLAQAQKVYYMANGKYADNFADLDWEIPWTGKNTWHNQTKDTRSNGEWSLQIFHNDTTICLMMGRLSGPYKGIGFNYYLSSSVYKNQTYCLERLGYGLSYTGKEGAYCTGIMNGIYIPEFSDNSIARLYELP